MGFNIGPRVIRATGGSISREGNFRVHTFPSRRVSEGLVFEVDLGNPNCTGRIKANSTFVDGIIKDLSKKIPIGGLWNRLAQDIGFRYLDAGKVMGLAGYG